MWKRRIIWAVLFLLSVIAISYYGGTISYSFFYTCIALPIVSGIYLLYVYRRFAIHQELETRNIVCGLPVGYCFILHNEDITVYTGIGVRLYSSFSHVENIEDNEVFKLFPGEKLEFKTKMTCKYRGEYDVGVKEILVYDFFGLFCIKYKTPTVFRALVTPRIVEVDELKSIPTLQSVLEMGQQHEKVEMDAVVRDYVYGDAIRKIHWKSTARQQNLKVRNEVGNRKQRLLVLFDMERVSDDIMEYLPLENKILETAIALAYYFAIKNTQVRLVWEADHIEKRDIMNLRHFEEVFQDVSTVNFRRNQKVDITLKRSWQGGLLSEDTFLFLVVHAIDETLYSAVERLVREERIVVLYVVTTEDISQYIRQSNMWLHIVAINPEQELSEVL